MNKPACAPDAMPGPPRHKPDPLGDSQGNNETQHEPNPQADPMPPGERKHVPPSPHHPGSD